MALQVAAQYNVAKRRMWHVGRRVVCRQGRIWRNPGRKEQWWRNLYDEGLPDSEWKKNLRMDRDVFMSLANEIRPYIQPGRSPRGLDVLSVEKQLALTLYFLKDKGSLSMTANAFGVACARFVSRLLSPLKIPMTTSATSKYTWNVQAVCDWKGFMNVEVKWPGSVPDGRVLANSRINKLFLEKKLPMIYKEILPGYDKIPGSLLRDPAYPLLPYRTREYPNTRTND